MIEKVIPNSDRWFDLTDLPEEEWRDIEGWEQYQVSNYSRIRTKKREGTTERIMKCACQLGYFKVGLHKGTRKNRIRYNTGIYRLSAMAFIPNPDNLPEVNHIDECKDNNHVSNLEWCTRLYNVRYGNHIERVSLALKNHPIKSKRVGQFTKDGILVNIWSSAMEAQRNGFSQGNISACCKGGSRTQHKGFKWRFLDENDNPTLPL